MLSFLSLLLDVVRFFNHDSSFCVARWQGPRLSHSSHETTKLESAFGMFSHLLANLSCRAGFKFKLHGKRELSQLKLTYQINVRLWRHIQELPNTWLSSFPSSSSSIVPFLKCFFFTYLLAHSQKWQKQTQQKLSVYQSKNSHSPFD